jgi:hypothetical protein
VCGGGGGTNEVAGQKLLALDVHVLEVVKHLEDRAGDQVRLQERKRGVVREEGARERTSCW